MPMTVVVTRDVPARSRGFLASVMLELAPGIYTAPRMNRAVRERVWAVLSRWHQTTRQGGIVMTWADPRSTAGQGVLMLGIPPKTLFDIDGVIVAARPLPPSANPE